MDDLGRYLAGLGDNERPREYHEIGVVTQIATASDPLLVALAGAATGQPVTNVARGYVPVVGDAVLVLILGATRSIVAAFAPVSPRWHLVGGSGEPGFTGSWSNFDPPSGWAPARFRRVGDIVTIEGVIGGGGIGFTAFVLPVGFRPQKRQMIPEHSSTAAAHGRLDIDTSGNVIPSAGGTTYFSIAASFTVT